MAAKQQVNIAVSMIEACQHPRLGVVAILIETHLTPAPHLEVRNVALKDEPQLMYIIGRAAARGGNRVASLN